MRILLFGKNGQVGWELQRSLLSLGELYVFDKTNGGDLTDLNALAQTVKHYKPNLVVNAAAYTAVDKAESEPEMATLVNSLAPKVLAEVCAELNACLVHYSTDYVFDGSGSKPWHEEDVVNPLNHYGRSKFEGEQAITASGCNHLILRTSWVYGSRGNNFIKTILKLARERESLSIVDDQIGASAGASLLADVTAHMVKTVMRHPHMSGLYHVVPSGETSWYEYACFVISLAKKTTELFKIKDITPIASSKYITPAARPLNSRLDCSKIVDAFSLNLPHWQFGVQRCLNEILGFNV